MSLPSLSGMIGDKNNPNYQPPPGNNGPQGNYGPQGP